MLSSVRISITSKFFSSFMLMLAKNPFRTIHKHPFALSVQKIIRNKQKMWKLWISVLSYSMKSFTTPCTVRPNRHILDFLGQVVNRVGSVVIVIKFCADETHIRHEGSIRCHNVRVTKLITQYFTHSFCLSVIDMSLCSPHSSFKRNFEVSHHSRTL